MWKYIYMLVYCLESKDAFNSFILFCDCNKNLILDVNITIDRHEMTDHNDILNRLCKIMSLPAYMFDFRY